MGGVGVGRSKREGIYVFVYIADSLCCIAETNTRIKQLYSNLKKVTESS